MSRWAGIVAVGLAAAGCGAGKAADEPAVGKADLTPACATDSVEVDLALCRAVQPRDLGRSPERPMPWGPTPATAPFSRRLRCPGGAIAKSRYAGQIDQEGQVHRWVVGCPGQPAFYLYQDVQKCGIPCPPAGLLVAPAQVEAALQAAEAALDEGDKPGAVDRAIGWAQRALAWSPEDERGLELLHIAELQKEKPAEALATVRRLRRLDPGSPKYRWHEAQVALLASARDKGPLPEVRMAGGKPAALPPPAVRYARLLARDVDDLDGLGALTGAAAIEAEDLRKRDTAKLALVDRQPWLAEVCKTAAHWELVRQAARSGEAREETWLEVLLGPDGLQDVRVARHPGGLLRAVLRDPAKGLAQLQVDLPVLVGALPPPWAWERVQADLSVPLLVQEIDNVARLAWAESDPPTIDEAIVLATLGWGTKGEERLFHEIVSVVRMIQAAGSGEAATRQRAIEFLRTFVRQADLALEPLAAPQGLAEATRRDPALYHLAGVLQALADRARATLGLPPLPALPQAPLDAERPDWPPEPEPRVEARK